MAVDAKLTIKCGKRGSGKTRETLDELYKAVNECKRRALIFDVKNEFGDYLYTKEPLKRHSIKAIDLSSLNHFTYQHQAELVRLAPFDKFNRPLSTDELLENLDTVLQNYRNGILLAEDLSMLIADNMPKNLYGSLSTLRQAGVDVVAHFQMVGKAANPKLIAHANYIGLHKTEDSVTRYHDRFGEKIEIMTLAEKIVNARYRWGKENKIESNKGIYFGVIVDVDYNKIRGIFNKDEALSACRNLVDEMNLGQKRFNQKNEWGKKKYASYNQAFNVEVNRMMEEYFIFQ